MAVIAAQAPAPGERHGTPEPATATAWQRPDGTWRLTEQDWGDFAGETLDAAYAKAAAYIAGQAGEPAVLIVRLHRPGAPEDWQILERHGYLPDDDEAA